MKRILSVLALMVLLLPVNAQNPDHSFSVAKNLDIFNSIYRQLDIFYVDTLEADKVLREGIDAMLESLDPYTVYYPEEEMKDLKMLTAGKYGGIGSMIRMRKDSTVIIAEPYVDMPAAEVGLEVGDVLRFIDGKDLKGMSVSEVSDMLRGEPGTTFVLQVLRPGEKKMRDFRITRRNIKVPAVPFTGIVGDGKIGYICLTQFTEECSKDVRKAVISLKEKGAQGIVLDLRNNGGGLLSEAVEIVNLFVPKGLKIVETKGKIVAANSTYTTKSEPLDLNIPLVVLVNGNTASAAEIVSGSLQDLDRAVIIGTKTFGKGLVQNPRELPYNGSIKLTTAKYYIPSGRCIQAIDYKKRRQELDDARQGKKTVQTKADSLKSVFHTAGGREVVEGSGIKPDIEIKHDTMANVVYYLSNDDVLVDWGTKYRREHPSLRSVKEFSITDADYEAFKEMVKGSDFKYDRLSEKRFEELVKMAKFEDYYDDAKAEFDALQKKLEHNVGADMDKHTKDVRRLMANEVVKRYFFQAGSVEQSLKDDEDLDRAVEVIENSEEYKKILEVK